MFRLIAIGVIVMMTLNSQDTRADERLRVLMTVGGVGYNTWIVRMLAANPAIDLRVRSVDDYQELFTPGVLTEVDAVLMYHRDNSAEAGERAALLEFLERGGGVVVLHHALANYADWEHWWQDQLGGLYVLPGHADLPPSQYSHYFKGSARIARPHPVTERLGAFLYLQDESYDRLWVSEAVSVLLQTTAVGSDGRLAWVGPAPSQRVVYIQPGHDETTLIDPRYLMLLEDALRWTAR